MSDAGAQPRFVVTKQYRRFAEFCDACRRYRYIGLCYGPPGVGKTLSARHYAQWELVEPYVLDYILSAPPPEIIPCRTIVLHAERPQHATPDRAGGTRPDARPELGRYNC